MFKFINNKIKFSKIEKLQTKQHVIFVALDGGEYFFGERLNKIPPKADSFEVDFELAPNGDFIRINMHINNKKYSMDVNTKNESATYFINFLESIYCFKSWNSIVYVSASDRVSDYFCIQNIETEPYKWRIMALLDAKKDKKVIDICVDERLFRKEFLITFEYCYPFNTYIEEAKELLKYSPNKVKLPLP